MSNVDWLFCRNKKSIKLKKYKVYISYNSATKKYADEYYSLLIKDKLFKPWMLDKNIIIGQEWRIQKENALHQADIYLLLIDQYSNSINSQAGDIMNILDLRSKENKYIIPLVFNAKGLDPNLKKFKGISVSPDNLKKAELLNGLHDLLNSFSIEKDLLGNSEITALEKKQL